MHIVGESSPTIENVTLNSDGPTVADCEFQVVQEHLKTPRKEALAARHGISVPPGNVARATILFVEDEEVLRSAVASMLRKKDFNVLEAADGSIAIDLLRAHGPKISALLLDVCLPGSSSKDVLQEARRIQPAIPVLVASALTQSRAESSFNGLHVDCFIRKPYRLAVLMELLETVLPTV
jgi:CheY-like chemotaxis protein